MVFVVTSVTAHLVYKAVGKLAFSHAADGRANGVSPRGKQSLQTHLPFDPTTSLLGIYPTYKK